MIHECTDCSNCADFAGAWRLICVAEGIKPDAVCAYHPLGTKDAYACPGFDETERLKEFTEADWDLAEAHSRKEYGEVNYKGLREWIEQEVKQWS